MSKYTEQNPFFSEAAWRIWRTPDGVVHVGSYTLPCQAIAAVAEFLAAEREEPTMAHITREGAVLCGASLTGKSHDGLPICRDCHSLMLDQLCGPDEWAWSNDDRTEARKGRWTARNDDGKWVFHHDDFIPETGIAPYWAGSPGPVAVDRIAAVVAPIIKSFHTWHAAQQFTPLPVPEVGTWGRFEYEHTPGCGVEAQVLYVRIAGTAFAEVRLSLGGTIYIPLEPEWKGKHRPECIAWVPIDPPQPSEPDIAGRVLSGAGNAYTRYSITPSHWGNAYRTGVTWEQILAEGSGPVTVLSEGVPPGDA